ncbi:hypothetical protein VF21_05204 [Pseudogymnoascus sp. 05NY08]|nr:hypothetical protein VF21_05204 [Pseudogymnoascus sp. 05NY08]
MSYNPPHNNMAYDSPELSFNSLNNNEDYYGEPQSMFYDWPMSRRDYHPSPSPSPPRLRNAPFIGYWSPTHSSFPFHREPIQEPTQEPTHEPTQQPTQQGANPPSPNQRSYSSSHSPSNTTYSAPSSPSMPELEDQSYAHYSPFSDNDNDNDNDSESSDTEYTPSPTEPTEPGLEYDSSFPSSSSSASDSASDSESEVDEMASRGRSRSRPSMREENEREAAKRALIRERNEREARLRVAERALREEVMAKVMSKTAVTVEEGLDRSLKESLVALRVQELKKAVEENEKKRETPRWIRFLKKLLILILLFATAFATVWVVNEVHYRGGLPYVKLFRGYVFPASMFPDG